ncbi:hypothetical protein Tco_0058612 [Tanacetum coccineum]
MVYALGLRERMAFDLEARLIGEALILNRPEDLKFGDFIELNDLNEPLELRSYEIWDLGPMIKEGEVIDEPKAYIFKTRNDDMIFSRDACVEARRFDGFITIHNGNDSVTYQMARSHLRFKHLSNEQCNKIRPIPKANARGKLEGKSRPYQKLKELFKGVLILKPEYIRDEKKGEWLTRRHVSMHEMD